MNRRLNMKKMVFTISWPLGVSVAAHSTGWNEKAMEESRAQIMQLGINEIRYRVNANARTGDNFF